jgi:TolA-binding protein
LERKVRRAAWNPPVLPESPRALPRERRAVHRGATGGSEADKLYVDGYARFNTGDYAKAKDEFSEFLARSPESDLADDAQYWIGSATSPKRTIDAPSWNSAR